jgi:hypothetical protein
VVTDVRTKAALVGATAALWFCGCSPGSIGSPGFNLTLPQWECTSADTWVIRGFQYDNFPALAPGELLAATVRRGDVVPLRVGTLASTGCDASVAQVRWTSTSPDVATVAANGALGAELRAVNAGDTRVSADLTLADGGRVTAELHAVPTAGSPLLRVYVVRVVR